MPQTLGKELKLNFERLKSLGKYRKKSVQRPELQVARGSPPRAQPPNFFCLMHLDLPCDAQQLARFLLIAVGARQRRGYSPGTLFLL